MRSNQHRMLWAFHTNNQYHCHHHPLPLTKPIAPYPNDRSEVKQQTITETIYPSTAFDQSKSHLDHSTQHFDCHTCLPLLKIIITFLFLVLCVCVFVSEGDQTNQNNTIHRVMFPTWMVTVVSGRITHQHMQPNHKLHVKQSMVCVVEYKIWFVVVVFN